MIFPHQFWVVQPEIKPPGNSVAPTVQPEIKPPGNSVAPPAYVWEESAGLHVGGEAAHPAHNHRVRFTPVSSSKHVTFLKKVLTLNLAGNYGFKDEFQSKGNLKFRK